MTDEAGALRQAHNFSPPSTIADVARTLRGHVEFRDFETTLTSLPPGAVEFWSIAQDD